MRKRISKRFIHLNIHEDLLERIDQMCEKLDFEDRTKCIEYLLDTAMTFITKLNSMKTEELMHEIRIAYEQLKKGTVIDYTSGLSDKDLRLLYDIIKDEFDVRFKPKKNSIPPVFK